jgi:hypothetical protein
MGVDERVDAIARVVAVLAGFQAILSSETGYDDLDLATANLVDSINQRNGSARLLAQRAIDLERLKRHSD